MKWQRGANAVSELRGFRAFLKQKFTTPSVAFKALFEDEAAGCKSIDFVERDVFVDRSKKLGF